MVGPVSTSQAEVAHVHSGSFSVPDTPIYVAVDESSGSIYVLTTHTTASLAGRIYKFDSSGTPSNFLSLGSSVLNVGCTILCRQLAVDNSGRINQGVLYLGTSITGLGTGPTTTRGVRVFLPNGRPSTTIQNFIGDPQFAPAFCGAAVDREGILYNVHPPANVGTYKPEQIHPDPDPPQVWPLLAVNGATGSTNGCRTAVDSEGRVFVGSNSSGNTLQAGDLRRYSLNPFSNGTSAPVLVDTNSTGHAVDQARDDLYSNHTTSIIRFNSDGEPRETFGNGQLAESGPVAVDSTDGTVYAANRGAKTVQIFTTVITPDVSDTAAEAGQTTADLSGTVETAGAGAVTSCEFEYGPTSAFGTAVPCDQAVPYNGFQEVTTSLSSLTKETLYHYRVVVTNANGTTRGPTRTFRTRNVASVSTDPATEITQTTATLNGSFVGNGEETSYYFEWGTTASYGNTTSLPPGDSAGAPNGPTSVATQIEGLEPAVPGSQPYHYRLVATNSSGSTYGPDRTFFTAPSNPPQITGVETAAVSSQQASISAVIDPRGAASVYWVEYGTTGSYGSTTQQSESLDGQETHEVGAALAGLTPGTTYHYRVVASNFGGVTASPNQTFSTPAAPVLHSTSVVSVTETTADLEAVISPGFLPTTYRFEYGLTRAYGASTAILPLGALSNVPQAGRASVGDLRPGVSYHYRVITANDLGEVAGPDQVIRTNASSPVIPRGDDPRRGQCRLLGRQAKRQSTKAKRLRRSAARSPNRQRTRGLKRRARKAATRARELNGQARACRSGRGSA